MENSEQKKLSFHGVEFPKVNFQAVNRQIKEEKRPISISITPRVFCPSENKNTFTIVMDVQLHGEDFFDLEITAFGLFQINGDDISDEERHSFININSVAIMFPYVRAFIANFTSSIGGFFETLHIPTSFFKGDLEEITLPAKERADEKVISEDGD